MMEIKGQLYCHFSFRRPRDGSGTGIFAVAFYKDYAGKRLVLRSVKKLPLWKDHQFVTSIQSYENALHVIHRYQGQMRNVGVNQIMLVTDNSTLAGWIENPRKNKEYTSYMERANSMYRSGGPKEVVLGIGLCAVRKAEKSYKFCREEYLTDTERAVTNPDIPLVAETPTSSELNLSDIPQDTTNPDTDTNTLMTSALQKPERPPQNFKVDIESIEYYSVLDMLKDDLADISMDGFGAM